MDILKLIKKHDNQKMLDLLLGFPEQFEKALKIGNSFKFTIAPGQIDHIIFGGMGGSAIGGEVIISCLSKELKIPAMVQRSYSLPKFANSRTMVIISSFSGNTEESLSLYENARESNSKIICITSGGELEKRANANAVPIISIPGGMQPRCALGYLSIPILVFLKKSGIAMNEDDNFAETLALLHKKSELYSPRNQDNLALNIAKQFYNKIPIIYSSNDMMHAAAMRWKAQISENAKTMAFYNVFPELNHNEIVGWQQLPELLRKFQIIYLRDKEDSSRNQSRMEITKEILEQETNQVFELYSEGSSKLSRLFSIIYLGDMVSYYLAILNNLDPTPIKKIQILKDKLKDIY